RNASNDGVTLTITPQTRDEKGNIVDGTPQVVEVKDGVKGDKGDTGAAGTNGKDGVDGKSPEVSTSENPDGSHTVTIKNPNGTTTSFVVKNGQKGDKGDKGETGAQGATGENGKDGLAPKVTAVRNANNDGVTLTITPQVRDEKGNVVDGTPQVVEVKDGAKGAKGEKGDRGETGAQGAAGVNGKDGIDGKSPEISTTENPDGSHTVTIKNPNGTTTSFVVKNGAKGDKGDKGDKGETGANGKDGLTPKVTAVRN
ncbi:collagen-flanked surface repeat-containing protein, partial [Aerococcus loyolae]